jgi:hypothetical protein
MKKRYLLPFLQAACFILLSLLLQNCGGLENPPIQEERELTEIIEQIEGQVSIIGEEQEQESNPLPSIMPELWQEILSYLDFEEVLGVRSIDKDWNKLITGYREAGIVGVNNKPQHIIDTRNWVKRKEINFRNNKLKGLTPATIPSFAFYYLMGRVNNLPQEFWPYLKGTRVHTLNLEDNKIGDQGARELAKALPATRVHTLNLGYNGIRDAGAIELAKYLQRTRVHTLYLSWNEIGDAGASELAKALPATRVHTLRLEYNQIRAAGASEIAKALSGTQVHTLDLNSNQIGDAAAIELVKALPSTRVHTIYLNYNQIGDAGAIELAWILQGTRVYTVNLIANQIGPDIKRFLVEQYPHINWVF